MGEPGEYVSAPLGLLAGIGFGAIGGGSAIWLIADTFHGLNGDNYT